LSPITCDIKPNRRKKIEDGIVQNWKIKCIFEFGKRTEGKFFGGSFTPASDEDALRFFSNILQKLERNGFVVDTVNNWTGCIKDVYLRIDAKNEADAVHASSRVIDSVKQITENRHIKLREFRVFQSTS